MKPTKLTGPEDLESALQSIGMPLNHDVTAYLIGGCAMMLYGAKLATKDVDLVLRSEEDAREVVDSLMRNGFRKVKAENGAYMNLGTTVMMEDRIGHHIDIFVGTVCKKLLITDRMISRSRLHATFGRLTVNLVSPEDIFLFKGMTERTGDLNDMRLLAERDLDWSVILDECSRQSHGAQVLEGFLAIRLQELEDEFGIVSPIRQVLEDATIRKTTERLGR